MDKDFVKWRFARMLGVQRRKFYLNGDMLNETVYGEENMHAKSRICTEKDIAIGAWSMDILDKTNKTNFSSSYNNYKIQLIKGVSGIKILITDNELIFWIYIKYYNDAIKVMELYDPDENRVGDHYDEAYDLLNDFHSFIMKSTIVET